ncbi:hypothetical protein KPATCC21470_1032 [Kitasatospora purpeofusca]
MAYVLPAGKCRPPTSCPDCFGWGVLPGRTCGACQSFRRHEEPAECSGCHRAVRLKKGYCRLCWHQASQNAKGEVTLLQPYLEKVRHHQLFLTNLHRPRCPGPPRGKRQGRPRLPDPAPALPPASGGVQPALFEARRDFTRFDRREHARLDNPWLAWARHTAHRLGEAHGWPRGVCLGVDRALVIVLSGHAGGDVVRHSEMFPALRSRGLSVERTAEVLDRIGVFLDDRPSSFERWLESKLDGLAVGIRRDVQNWAQLLHDGGPRSQPRDVTTVWGYLNRLRPLLLEWSSRYDHLREVTREDVLAHLATVHGSQRKHTLVALRSLFTRAKKNGTIFKNPTSRIRVGQQESGVIQPLESEDVRSSVAAVTRPADRLILALAAVHAARAGAIRRLQLDDLDIGNRQLVIDGRVRPLDELTLQAALAWLEHRRRRWPDTANPHLLINKQTALESGPISGVSVSAALRGQTATLERLRVDRQLEEALAYGPDPLHLAEVFGLDEKTAIRYADSARQLLLASPGENPGGTVRGAE